MFTAFPLQLTANTCGYHSFVKKTLWVNPKVKDDYCIFFIFMSFASYTQNKYVKRMLLQSLVPYTVFKTRSLGLISSYFIW